MDQEERRSGATKEEKKAEDKKNMAVGKRQENWKGREGEESEWEVTGRGGRRVVDWEREKSERRERIRNLVMKGHGGEGSLRRKEIEEKLKEMTGKTDLVGA